MPCKFCGKKGKPVCDSCLNKIKEGSMCSLFPMSKSETAAVTKACCPPPPKDKVDSSSPIIADQQSPTYNSQYHAHDVCIKAFASVCGFLCTECGRIINGVLFRPFKEDRLLCSNCYFEYIQQNRSATINSSSESVAEEKSEMTDTVASDISSSNTASASYINTSDEASPTSRQDSTSEDSASSIMYTNLANTSTVSHNSRGVGSWILWLVLLSIFVGFIVALIVLPWEKGQWFVAVPIGLIILVIFIVSTVTSYYSSTFVIHTNFLFILTVINFLCCAMIDEPYEIVFGVITLALVLSSLVVTWVSHSMYELIWRPVIVLAINIFFLCSFYTYYFY